MFDELQRMRHAIERASRELDHPLPYLTEALDHLEELVLDLWSESWGERPAPMNTGAPSPWINTRVHPEGGGWQTPAVRDEPLGAAGLSLGGRMKDWANAGRLGWLEPLRPAHASNPFRSECAPESDGSAQRTEAGLRR